LQLPQFRTPLDAQQSPENVPGSNTSSSGATSSDNAAIVAELEQMRARIAELENALRGAPTKPSFRYNCCASEYRHGSGVFSSNAALETQLAPPATTRRPKSTFFRCGLDWLNESTQQGCRFRLRLFFARDPRDIKLRL